MNKQYQAFLQSTEWKVISEIRKQMDGHACTRCGSKDCLEVHHKTYDMHPQKGLLDLDNMVTLCHSCHSSTHGFKYGQIELDPYVWCRTCAWSNDHLGPFYCLRTMSPNFGQIVDRHGSCGWYWAWIDVPQKDRKGHWDRAEVVAFIETHNQGEEEFK